MGCLALAGWQEEDASDEISKSSRCQRRGEGGREVLRTFRDGMVQAEPLAHGTRCISFPWCPEPNKPLRCCILRPPLPSHGSVLMHWKAQKVWLRPVSVKHRKEEAG